MALERELSTYQAHLMEWLPHEGKYVVVRGEEITGPYADYEAALKGGYERFGVVPFLVQKVHRPGAEPVQYFSRDLR